MLKNEDIICVSSIDWDFLWQGHQEIMTRLARNGNRVLFIENTGARSPRISDIGRIKRRIVNWRKGIHGIRKVEEGLYLYSPLILPFPYLRIARFINKKLMLAVLLRWLKAVGFSEPVLWVFLPTGLSLDLISEIDPKVLIYYCIDYLQASSRAASKIENTEKLLLKKADLVFVTSAELFRYCSENSRNVHYFPFGVNIENFTRVLSGEYPVPEDIKGIKRPIAGYVGGIHKWIDFDLLKYIAVQNKDISFVLCGPIQSDIGQLKDLSNVYFLGQKDAVKLPQYVKEFDVALIPYKLTEYTKNVYPTKLNEYLSLGKRVVSTGLHEIRKFKDENGDVVKIAATYDEFSKTVSECVRSRPSAEESALAIDRARKNSWANRIEEMSALVEAVEDEKRNQRDFDWKHNLARFYRGTKKKFIPAALSLALVYLAVFHTPMVWFMAKPLTIQDAPQRSDAIVALGGGVGESGKAGQGYEERVDLAVRLYKDGAAKEILYSSGYRYIMKEADVMRTLSIAAGVDKNDIIIDDSPVNTYEMIMHLKNYAKDRGWKKIIIISSPYHMRRLNLLFKKNMRDLEVAYVPVEYSGYYGNPTDAVRPRQIQGILQEYMALIYYKLKGYI